MEIKDANSFIFGEIFSKAYKKVYGEIIKVWEGQLNSKEKQKYKRTLVYFANLDQMSFEKKHIQEEFASLPLENEVQAIKEKIKKIELVEKLLSSLSSSLSKACKNATKKR